jgi:hypothetical protein
MIFYLYIVPLTNVPQVFTVNLAGVDYTLTVKWNDMAQSWYLDIADSSQNPIACGIPFVTGTSLLAQLEYLGIDGDLYVYTNGDANAVPTLDNLGTNSNLYFETTVANNGG